MRSSCRRYRLTFTLLASLVGMGACSDPSSPLGGAPHIIGTVQRVDAAAGRMSVSVNNLEAPVDGYDQILLHVRQPGHAAPIYVRHADGRLVPGDGADLRVGARVSAHTTGVELRSDPPQWTATRLTVEP